MSSANLLYLVLPRREVPLFIFVYNIYIYIYIYIIIYIYIYILYIYIYIFIYMVTVKGCTIPQTLKSAEISAKIVIFVIVHYGSI